MSWVDQVSWALASFGLARSASRGPLILTYHGMGGTDGVSPTAFEAQLRALSERRRIVPLDEAVACLGKPDAAGIAAITFDDGYCDFAELAVPVLERLGLNATLFVPAGHIGGWNRWDEGRAERREILSAAQLRSLDPKHSAIGAHGFSHCRVAGLRDADLKRETRDARAILEDACGRRVDLFAYPYGQLDDFDARAERAVADAGFMAACSTWFGRGSTPQQRFRLRRVGIAPDDTLERVHRRCDGAYDWVAWKEVTGRCVRSLRGSPMPEGEPLERAPRGS